MSNFRSRLASAGYDSEEAYFHKLDRELIENTRSENRKHLKLIQGGKKDPPAETKTAKGGRPAKKAA